MEGPGEGPRIINGVEIIFGERSASDMKSWVCKVKGCGMLNKAIRMLVFDVAPVYCAGCKALIPYDFSICLANVRVNGVALINEVKCQQLNDGGECVSYSISHLIELMNSIMVAISSENPDMEKAASSFNPELLFRPHRELFPAGTYIKSGGVHKIIHMLQRFITGIGLPLKYYKTAVEKWVEHHFKGADVRIIHCNDFEEVTRQIADGNAVLAPLYVGKDYAKLKFCQHYTSVPFDQVAALKAQNIRVYGGHVLLLIGAVKEKEHKAYYALEQSGDIFCQQVGIGGWKSVFELFKDVTVGGGFGKINADSEFFANFFKVSRMNDEAVPPKKYDLNEGLHVDDGSDMTDMTDMMDPKLVAEEEGSTELTALNYIWTSHGKIFEDRIKRFGCH